MSLASATFVAYVRWNPSASLCRVLEWKPVVFLGTISYGVYLCHMAVRDIVWGYSRGLDIWEEGLVGLLLASLVSWISFRYYERPIIRWGQRVAKQLGEPQVQPATV